MTPRKPMSIRAVRVPDELWEEAAATAAFNEEALSDVIRAALVRYVAKHRNAQRLEREGAHSARAVPIETTDGGMVYRGGCTCGWVGEKPRESKGAASKDAIAHLRQGLAGE